MTDPDLDVLVPYSRFLELQDRRRRIAAELTAHDLPQSNNADPLQTPAEMASAQPLTSTNADH